ncbi:DEAD/DEAH box helicase [Anaerotruncus rubiinfantis]|uniref:DEAD/DEAH box helicase n=1 Tax=Anaerotruncus rubiinfantis TaxID=1720200 RepID=UPI00189BEA05|nr:DEAD/DEAH box helicase family protein [Anaerotruncus rubiinfantis]
MELKSYQKKVIADLTRYLELLNETRSDAAAFRLFWQEKSAPTLGLYQNVIPGVPNLCFKVPTGGGKTFIACNAVRPIFDALPATKTKAVVWLVPSDAILTQTAKALKDTSHPYRQKIDVDFGGRVEVYTKQELLNGQNFNPTAVTEQLSVMVLSYDSFRTSRKDGRKAFQENSNLAEFPKVLGKPDSPIEGADETALFQIINQLNPLVIVDESHHARSELSLEMLENFNPCFVLDLTATPKKESNIISYVDAVQLKNEHMVKLPVIVYNRDSQSEVLIDAIDLRNKLEEIADAEYAKTGKYIRPIALFQAQPKGKEDATTFEKLRDKLVDAGIPAEQIAIRTADVNELKNTDLMSPNCPIRYIITVNALKEGWDCPFAYILASLANKTSQVDVEQILGRILRLPHTSQHTQSALNMPYVLTSSNDFNNTVAHIVKGLNSAGFSDKDYRIGESAKPQIPEQPAEQITLPDQQGCSKTETPLETAEDDFSGLDGKSIGAELERRREQAQTPEIAPKANTMLDAAAEVEKAYTDAIQQTDNDPMMDNLPWEVRDKVKSFQVNPQFREDIETLQIPQFFLKVEQSLFTDGSFELLDKEMLAEGFTLKGKAYDIDFATADDEIREIDVREQDGGLPKVFKMESAEQRYFKEWFNNLPPESRVRQCKDMMFNQLNKLNMVDAAELKAYINRIVDDMDKAQLAAMEKAPLGYAAKIRSKIETLLEAHYRENFERWLETERIVCKPYFRLRPSIHPATYTDIYARSLYAAEDGDMNKLEQKLIVELTALPNVRWWHRNIARQDFAINGFIKHYPDILIMTQSGKLICAETKGEHLKNDDSREKIALGQAWRTAAGKDFRYYMVFENEENLLPGAVSTSQFIDTIKEL